MINFKIGNIFAIYINIIIIKLDKNNLFIEK